MNNKRNHSIHVYFTDEEHARFLRVLTGLRTLGRGAQISKGDAAAALVNVAVDDVEFLAKVRKYLISEDKKNEY